jgi:hypothetical protein
MKKKNGLILGPTLNKPKKQFFKKNQLPDRVQPELGPR